MPSEPAARSRTDRLSEGDSLQFATAIRTLIDRHRLGSIDSIFPNVSYDRSTIHRWLSYRASSIPIDGAAAIIRAIREWAPHINDDITLQHLDDVIRSARRKTRFEARLRLELRKRRVPVNRVIDALRAVGESIELDKHGEGQI